MPKSGRCKLSFDITPAKSWKAACCRETAAHCKLVAHKQLRFYLLRFCSLSLWLPRADHDLLHHGDGLHLIVYPPCATSHGRMNFRRGIDLFVGCRFAFARNRMNLNDGDHRIVCFHFSTPRDGTIPYGGDA